MMRFFKKIITEEKLEKNIEPIVDISEALGHNYEPLRNHHFICYVYNNINEIAIETFTINKIKFKTSKNNSLFLKIFAFKTSYSDNISKINNFNNAYNLSRVRIIYLDPAGARLREENFNIIDAKYKLVLDYSKSQLVIEKFKLIVRQI